MSDKHTFPEIVYDTYPQATEVAEPTAALRWRGTVLEQNWLIRTGTAIRSEWHPVPHVDSF